MSRESRSPDTLAARRLFLNKWWYILIPSLPSSCFHFLFLSLYKYIHNPCCTWSAVECWNFLKADYRIIVIDVFMIFIIQEQSQFNFCSFICLIYLIYILLMYVQVSFAAAQLHVQGGIKIVLTLWKLLLVTKIFSLTKLESGSSEFSFRLGPKLNSVLSHVVQF